jgi:hypothetical protein
LDPFNWLLEGQLGVELEVGVLSWMSIEAVPTFVTAQSPPWLNLFNGDARIFQHSDGWGPMAGASVGVAFWPKKLFKGYAIRAGLIDQAMRYETKDDMQNAVDSVSHTKRELYAMLGTMERWGAFTIGGGFGLGYDLNKETRCYRQPAGTRDFKPEYFQSGDCNAIQIEVQDASGSGRAAITPFTYPWEILVRFSLGVTID